MMGCINSKKDLSDLNPNIYRVVNVDDNRVAMWSGHLEISRSELTLYRKGKDPTTWPLKCLRRYGFDADMFTFEAGRRCTTGEGIYAFRCRQADSLFQTLQNYLHNDESATNSGDIFPTPSASNGPTIIPRSRTQTQSSSISSRPNSQNTIINGGTNSVTSGTYVLNNNNGGTRLTSSSLSPSGTIQSNPSRSTDTLSADANYLEPMPLVAGAGGNNGRPRLGTTMRYGSVGSGPLSPEPHSPGSPNSISNILEVTTLNPLPSSHHGVSNLYQEFPLRDNSNQCNNFSSAVVLDTEANVKKLSLDIPPQEQAPGVGASFNNSAVIFTNAITPTTADIRLGDPNNAPCSLTSSPTTNCMTASDSFDNSHMYMNVTPGEIQFSNINNNTTTATPTDTLPCIGGQNTSSNNTPSITTTTSGGIPFGFQRLNSTFSMDPNRFYENLEPGEIRPLLLRNRYSKPDIFAKVELPLDKSEPCTPTIANRRVNYIVLDLDQANSVNALGANTNTTVTNQLASTTNAHTPGSCYAPPLNAGVAIQQLSTIPANSSTVSSPNSLLPPESPKKAALGYATIDFNKTVALSNSTTPSSDLDSEGSRKTRHSSIVATMSGPPARHSNSISD